MSVLAIHPGDLYLRAAFLGPLDAPHAVEDGTDPARFVTPSVVSVDAGGALLGYPALMTAALPRTGRVAFRYRRAALGTREVIACDAAGRALTADAFVALALRRLASDARAFAPVAPDLALALPDDLDATARARVAALAGACTGQAVSVVGEDEALLATLPDIAPGACLVASFDDDALRLRVARAGAGNGDAATAAVDASVVRDLGVGALRRRWLETWNADAATLVPAAAAFADGDTVEFERLWQDAWDALNAAAPDVAAPVMPLVRQSTLLPLCVHVPALLDQVRAQVDRAADAARDFLARARAAGVEPGSAIVVGEPVLARALAALLPARAALASARCHAVTPDRYARGAALLAHAGQGRVALDLACAPHGLCVLGLGEDGRATTRPLLAKETPLPAHASFTVVANRDVQRTMSVTVTGGDEAPDVAHRFDFGPLEGDGVQRVTVTVEWRRDGVVDAQARDRDTGAPIACSERTELAGAVPLAGAAHIGAL